jgi:hypothetical protein
MTKKTTKAEWQNRALAAEKAVTELEAEIRICHANISYAIATGVADGLGNGEFHSFLAGVDGNRGDDGRKPTASRLKELTLGQISNELRRTVRQSPFVSMEEMRRFLFEESKRY